MKFLRIVFTIGYLFFGSFCLYSIWELTSVNAWFNLFPIVEITPTEISFVEVETGTTEITFSYSVNGVSYTNSKRTKTQLISDRLNDNSQKIIVSYNKAFPKVSFLKNLKTESRSGYVGLIGTGFFVLLFLILDLVVDKKKWLNIYGIPE